MYGCFTYISWEEKTNPECEHHCMNWSRSISKKEWRRRQGNTGFCLCFFTMDEMWATPSCSCYQALSAKVDYIPKPWAKIDPSILPWFWSVFCQDNEKNNEYINFQRYGTPLSFPFWRSCNNLIFLVHMHLIPHSFLEKTLLPDRIWKGKQVMHKPSVSFLFLESNSPSRAHVLLYACQYLRIPCLDLVLEVSVRITFSWIYEHIP